MTLLQSRLALAPMAACGFGRCASNTRDSTADGPTGGVGDGGEEEEEELAAGRAGAEGKWRESHWNVAEGAATGGGEATLVAAAAGGLCGGNAALIAVTDCSCDAILCY